MSLAAWNLERGRTLLWVAATDSFVPASMKKWQPINLNDSTAQKDQTAPSSGYAVIFEATCNSMLNYDPIMELRAVHRYFGCSPDMLVAVVAPTLEVPIGAQHAIAYEASRAIGSPRLEVVTATPRQSLQTPIKLRKAKVSATLRDWTALDEALAIARGAKRGTEADQTARNLVYAYISRTRSRDPFRCTSLQREILRVLALAEFPPTASAIAGILNRAEGKVHAAFTELADALVPHGVGEPDRRDSRERLYWLTQNYGVWIRLVDQRQ
jgi:hypothetical protein